MLDRAKKMALWITLVELDQARRNGTLSPSEDEDDCSRPKRSIKKLSSVNSMNSVSSGKDSISQMTSSSIPSSTSTVSTSSISSALTSVLATPSPSEHATSPESMTSSSSEPGGDVVTPSNESPRAIVGMGPGNEEKETGILDLCEELLRDINRFQQNYGKKVEA
jgi:hypothetical protein